MCVILSCATFVVSRLSLSHLRKPSGLVLSLLALSLLLSALDFISVCVLVCLCVVLVFAGGVLNPGSSPTWPYVYPAFRLLLSTAFKSTADAMKDFSLCLSHCLFAFSVYIGLLLIAFVSHWDWYQSSQISLSFAAELCVLQWQPNKAMHWIWWQDEVL